MSAFRHQYFRPRRWSTLFACLFVFATSCAVHAGETAVEPSGNGIDMLQDTTDEGDARSSETSAAAEDMVDAVSAHPHDVPLADAVTTAEEKQAEALLLLGSEVEAGSTARLSWSATELFEGVPVSTPVLAVNGALPGPTLCLTAAVHGDELNGIEMVRRVMHDIDPDKLSGAVIGVPIVNVQGFRRGSRRAAGTFRAIRVAAPPRALRMRCSLMSSRIATHWSTFTQAPSNAPTCHRFAPI